MNISILTVEELRKLGWDVIRVSEVMDIKAKDKEILDFAAQEDRILITLDLDFSMLLAISNYKKPSVINLRLEDARPKLVTQRVIEVVNKLKNEFKKGIVVSADEMSIRYRNLPLKID